MNKIFTQQLSFGLARPLHVAVEVAGLVAVLRQDKERHKLVVGTTGHRVRGSDAHAGRGSDLQVEGGALLQVGGGARVKQVREANQTYEYEPR